MFSDVPNVPFYYKYLGYGRKTRGRIEIEYESDVKKSKDNISIISDKLTLYIDCKINAFSYNTEYTVEGEVQLQNKTAASFIMIDLDLKDFESQISKKEKLDKQLIKIVDKLLLKFHGEAHLYWFVNRR